MQIAHVDVWHMPMERGPWFAHAVIYALAAHLNSPAELEEAMSRNAHWYTWPMMLAIACGGDGGKKGEASDQDAGHNPVLDAGDPDASTEPDSMSDASVEPDASVSNCPAGFEPSGGACVAAPCSELDCGAHGTCVEVEGAAQCSCSAGFAGDHCDTCADGYEGDACDTCADGFVQGEQGCLPDVCIGVSCGAHGICVDEQGSPACECHEGWAGDDCDTCALGWASKQGQCVLEPHTLVNLRIWQDASASSTLRFDAEGRVTEWRSRIPGEEELAFEAGASESSRPGTATGEGQRRRISFDGDDALTRTFTLNNNAYTMYVVARWDAAAARQWILGGTNAQGTMHGIQLYADASSLVYRHRFPFAITGGENVSSDDYTPAEGLQLIVIQRSNAGDGYLRQYFGADYVEAAPLVSSAINESLRTTLGQSGLSGTGALQGEIAEVLVYGGVHSQATRDQITSHLHVKWGMTVPGQQL